MKRIKDDINVLTRGEPLLQPADRPIGTHYKEDMVKQTTENWLVEWVYLGKHRQMYIPKGTIYDSASVPGIFRCIIRPDGLIRAASLTHDELFRSKGGLKFLKNPLGRISRLTDRSGKPVTVTFNEANFVLYDLMVRANMPRRKARLARRACSTNYAKYMFWGKPARFQQKIKK